MDFLPTAEQTELRDGMREVCRKRFPAHRLREAISSPAVVDEVWSDIASTGFFGLHASPDRGGLGLGLVESVLVVEELGYALVPGPLIATHLAAGLLDGDHIVGILEPGPPLLIEHLARLDTLLLLDSDGVTSYTPSSVAAAVPVEPLDPLTPLHHLAELPDGTIVAGPETVADWRLQGAIMTAAYQVGIAQATLDRSVRFAKEREQFGRPVGSFQAVKHILAEMLVRTELARCAVHAAAVTWDDGDSAGRAASGAKLLADEAATGNATDAVQVHGGMGFTWEVDIHLYLKRAWVLASTFGTSDEHAELLASFL